MITDTLGFCDMTPHIVDLKSWSFAAWQAKQRKYSQVFGSPVSPIQLD
jgi:hypothetical protein